MQRAPKQMEFLKNPENSIALCLKNENSSAIFSEFVSAIQRNEAKFTPVLGLHNCPAEIEFIAVGDFETKTGDFATQDFIKAEQIDSKKLSRQINFALA